MDSNWNIARDWLIAAGFAVSCLSCAGKAQNDSGHVSGPVPSQDFAAQFATSFCSGIAGCCAAGSFAFDLGACERTMQTQLEALFTARMSNEKISFDADAAALCVNSYHDANAACTDRARAQSADDPCELVFQGTVAPGGACSESQECSKVAGAYVGCDQGICTQQTDYSSVGLRGKLGDACTSTCTDSGNGGSSCSGFMTTTAAACWTNDNLGCSSANVCIALPAIGESCVQSNYHCAAGAYCNSGTCAAQLTSGSCATSSEACASSSYCDSPSNQCKPKKTDGETCNQDSECLGGDCLGDRCRKWSVATPSTCAGLVDD